MLRFVLFIFIFISSSTILNAQELLTTSGYKSVDDQCNNAIQLVTKDAANNFKTAMEMIKNARDDAENKKNLKAVCITWFAEATVLKRMGSFSTAISGIEKAIAAANNITDINQKNEMLAYCYHYLGFIYQSQSDWKNTLESYYKALEYAKTGADQSEYLMILTRIGDIFQAQGDSKNAEKYFLEALEKDNHKNPVMSIEIFITYANMLLETQPQKSVEMSEKALQLAKQHNIDKKNYNIYFNLSGAYFTMQNMPKSIAMLDTAIASAQKQNKSLTQFYLGLAQIMEADKKPGKSEENYLKAIAEAKKENDLYMEMQTVSYLKNFYKSTGQTDQFVKALERENVLKDSIRSSQMAIATQEMDYRYQTEKKEAAIGILTRANNLKTFLMIALSVAAISLLLLFYNKRKQARLKVAYYQNREQMLEQQAYIAKQNTLIEKEAKEKAQLSELLKAEENLHLQRKIESTNRELATTTLYIQEKNKLLENLQGQISKFFTKDNQQNKKELIDISKSIKNQISFENDWPKIKMHFEKVHPEFFEKLSALCPSLTQTDLKNCAYIKMKLNHKEIANLMGLDYNSVKMARYRIKKKLNLDKESDLNEFIESL